MNGQAFVRTVERMFLPFLREAGFPGVSTTLSGKLYRASFAGAELMVSVSFEPGDDALFVIVFTRENDGWSDMDNRESSPRLSDLNARYLGMVGPEERAENEVYFRSIEACDAVERAMLKAAKELRLVLPMYIADRAGHVRQGD